MAFYLKPWDSLDTGELCYHDTKQLFIVHITDLYVHKVIFLLNKNVFNNNMYPKYSCFLC